MRIANIFVHRPVMTTMLYLGIAVFGVLSWTRLSQELFPNITVPQLVVITKYANAAPEEIEYLITKPMEEAVGTVPDLRRVRSTSKEGLSAVTLDFGWDTDMGFAHLSVREKLDRIKDRLPQEAEESIIKRVNPFAQPILVLSATSEMELVVLTELCEEVVKKNLEKVDGVGTVVISGGQKREILVEVDRGRLDAHRVSLPMVVDSLKNANYDYPAGVTQGRVVEYLVRTQGRFQHVSEIDSTVIHVEQPEVDPIFGWRRRGDRDEPGSTGEQRLTFLRNLAETRMGLKERTSYSRYNGRENVSISIQKQAGANTVQVSRGVKRALEELRMSLPRTMNLDVVYDESDYILASLGNMRNNVLLGGLLAFVVLFYFLGSFRNAVTVGIAIPTAIMASLIMMVVTGLSINLLTLAGLALAVGMLSDSAIVVAENISRHNRALKKPMKDAAIDGANQMVSAMASAALTNIAVFLPLLFITGLAQKLFQDLLIVTVLTALSGLVIALTLVPRMTAHDWTLPAFFKRPRFLDFKLTDERRLRLEKGYTRRLGFVLNHPLVVAEVIVMLVALAVLVVVISPKVFMPKIDQRQFIVQLNMPIGTRLEVTNLVAGKLESILSNAPDINVMVNVGSTDQEEDLDALEAHEAQVVVTLEPRSRRSTDEVIEFFKRAGGLENLEGGRLTYMLQDSPLRSALAGGAPVEIEIKGPDLDRLRAISNDIVDRLERDPHFFGVETTLGVPSRETQVNVDRDRAAAYHLSVADVARTALIAIRGVVATTFKEGGKETDIRVRLREQDRKSAESIRLLSLRSPQGAVIPLDAVAAVRSGVGTTEIRHLDQQRAVIVTAQISGMSSNAALDRVRQMIAGYRAYTDYTVELGGESQRMAESFASLQYTFLLALLLIYMIMAAQFESFSQPLIIMFTVPFAFIGVAFTLFVTNTPFSAVVALGVVILAGLVVNNGIVLIDHTNGLRKSGLALREAVITGARDRLQPILLTTVTTIFGVLPLALGLGRTDDLAQPLALVTFGGLFVSTLLTLFVIPLLYFKLATWQEKGGGRQP